MQASPFEGTFRDYLVWVKALSYGIRGAKEHAEEEKSEKKAPKNGKNEASCHLALDEITA